MKPTNEQIIREARRRAKEQNWRMDIEDYIIEVMRENWTPPEPVDPDILAFREWYADGTSREHREDIFAGVWDQAEAALGFLAGARTAREQEHERAKPLVDYIQDLGYSEQRAFVLDNYEENKR